MTREAWIVAGSMLVLAGCGAPDAHRQDMVARVGGRAIDVKELSRSYALRPQWKRGDRVMQSYLRQLQALITEKIYAQEAEKLGIDRDSLMARHLEFLRQKELIKALYRRHVTAAVRINESEEHRLYAWAKKKVDFEYILTRDSVRSVALAAALARGGVNSIPSDPLVVRGIKADAKIGSVPPPLEEPLFTARLHEVRGPLRTPDGFLCFRITGGEEVKFLSENDFAGQREKIDRLLRQRKEDSLASLYVYTVMRDKDLRLNGQVFWRVAEWFGRRVREEHLDPMNIQSVHVTSDEIRLVEADLAADGDAVIATHRDGTLSVQQLLSALASMPGTLRPRVRTPQQLKDAIGWIVRNQYLTRQAEAEGLESDQEFRHEYSLQRDEALAEAYYEDRLSSVRVAPEEVEAFRQKSPVAEEQVLVKLDMAALARNAKTDSLLQGELPALTSAYGVAIDTARVREMTSSPDAILRDAPLRIAYREIFQ
ncbi:MAG: hypothetical protein AB1428_02670 [Bacteroidota bacterium]